MALYGVSLLLAASAFQLPTTRPHWQLASLPADEALPSVEEALRDADLYAGPEPKDMSEIHPNDLPMLYDWTAEDFKVFYEEGGHAPWEQPLELAVAIGFHGDDQRATSVRRAKHLDHLFWARSATQGDARVHASYSLLKPDTDDSVVGSLVATAYGDSWEARFKMLDTDPFHHAGVFERRQRYRWLVDPDPYLCYQAWSEEDAPFVIIRTLKSNYAALFDLHLSFLRKTKRILKTGLLYAEHDSQQPVGELLVTFHPSKEHCDMWLSRDPLRDAAETFWYSRYCDLDVSGEQVTQPFPLNRLADPLKARLVDAGLVQLPVRTFTRVEFDPGTGKYTPVNITTNDPRYTTNVVQSLDLTEAASDSQVMLDRPEAPVDTDDLVENDVAANNSSVQDDIDQY